MFPVYPIPRDGWENILLCLIIIIKSEVWTIIYCLGLGHETMLCAVRRFISLPHISYMPLARVTYMALEWHMSHMSLQQARGLTVKYVLQKVFKKLETCGNAIKNCLGWHILHVCHSVEFPCLFTRVNACEWWPIVRNTPRNMHALDHPASQNTKASRGKCFLGWKA